MDILFKWIQVQECQNLVSGVISPVRSKYFFFDRASIPKKTEKVFVKLKIKAFIISFHSTKINHFSYNILKPLDHFLIPLQMQNLLLLVHLLSKENCHLFLFCRKLISTIDKINNIGIYVFLTKAGLNCSGHYVYEMIG